MADKKLDTKELKQVSGGAMSQADYEYARDQIEARLAHNGADRNAAMATLSAMYNNKNKNYDRAYLNKWLDEECE